MTLKYTPFSSCVTYVSLLNGDGTSTDSSDSEWVSSEACGLVYSGFHTERNVLQGTSTETGTGTGPPLSVVACLFHFSFSGCHSEAREA